MVEHNADPGQRKAQHLLASEVLEMVHGLEEAAKTRAEHQMMRNPSRISCSSQTTSGEKSSEQDANRISLPKSQVLNTSVAHVLFYAGLAKSKSEGTRMIEKGGVYVAPKDGTAGLSFVKIDAQTANDAASLLVDNMLILRLGKWKVRVIEVVDNQQSQHQKRTSAHSNG
jgi:tyrosyl-tRNA synthetase